MSNIQIKFPNGEKKTYSSGITPQEILNEFGGSLKKKTVAANYNDQLVDLNHSLNQDGSLLFVSYDSPEGIEVFWHSTAHIMAHAIKNLYPEAKFGFGPALDDRFFYDFDIDKSLSPENFEEIEKEMKNLIDQNNPFIRENLSQKEAVALFKKRDEPYKVEHIEELEDSSSIYREGDFVDLCSGPHLPS
ncbi:TGS domain-containing protein, partial [candidate division KSB1 bacterium]|nr:TGS domain-containing protein [candidate division KSB1 bacterium]